MPRSSAAEQSLSADGSTGWEHEYVGLTTAPNASLALLRRFLTLTVGGGSTVREAGAGAALLPAEELTAPGASAKLPVWLGVTDTENVQLAAALTEPPVREIACAPGLAVITPAEPQVPFSPLGLSMVSPAGSVSVNATAERVPLAFGLAIVTDREVAELSLSPIRLGVNAVVTVGGAAALAAGAASAKPAVAPSDRVSAPTPRRLPRPSRPVPSLRAMFLTSVPSPVVNNCSKSIELP